MKRLAILGILASVVLLVAPVAVIAATPPNGITGNVTVVNTPLPVTGSVGLSGNSESSPLFVSDVDKPERHAFQASTFRQCPGNDVCAVEFTVPDGQLLVIETLTVTVQLPTGQRALVGIHPGSNVAIPLQFQGNFPSGILVPGDVYVAALPLRLYSNPGRTVRIAAQKNSETGSYVLEGSISGYWVACDAGSDCPLP